MKTELPKKPAKRNMKLSVLERKNLELLALNDVYEYLRLFPNSIEEQRTNRVKYAQLLEEVKILNRRLG